MANTGDHLSGTRGLRKACVLGSYEFWDLVRPLGLAGIQCTLFSTRDDSVRYSRHVTEVHDRCDSSSDPDELLRRLISYGEKQEFKPLLVFSTDADLLFVSRNHRELQRNFLFILPDPEVIESLVDKALFTELAIKLGLPIPTTQVLSAKTNSFEALQIPYPVIIKPSQREKRVSAGTPSIREAVAENAKAIQVNSLKQMKLVWKKISQIDTNFILQELVPGPEDRIESYHAYIDNTGNVVAAFTGRKIRTYSTSFGYSTALTTTDAPDVHFLGQRVLRLLNCKGAAKVDFKRRPDGTLALLEVNPRYSIWLHLGAVAGLNILDIISRDLSNQPRGHIGSVTPNINYCKLRDFYAAREHNIPPLRWGAWYLSSGAKEFAFDDMRPFIHKVIGKTSHFIKS